MKLVFDIETDGFLKECTRIHSLCVVDVDKPDTMLSYTDHAVYAKRTGTIEDGLSLLSKASMLIGHNIMSFDIPAIKKIVPRWTYKGKMRDTLIMSRLQHVHDMNNHSLEQWGKRLKFAKGDFGKQTDWKDWSVPMQKYCEQDVWLNLKVWDYLNKEPFSEESIVLEHEFAWELNEMMKNGVHFDTAAALKLESELKEQEEKLRTTITANIPDFVDKIPFTPKVNNKARGYVKGVPTFKTKITPFNPSSRMQVARYLKMKHNWQPQDFTDTGRPKVSGDVLRKLPYPEAPMLADYYDCKKLLGQLSTGDVAWLKRVKNGRIYGRINHNGAVTGRSTHSSPNLGQIPSVGNFKGEESRSLFGAGRGRAFVGCDASGLELRNLSHYMYIYDGGAYATEVLDGDIHTANQEAAGLPTRPDAKRFIYAFLYGCGDEALGYIIDPATTSPKHLGATTKRKFFAKIPAMKKLIYNVQRAAMSRGYLIGLDGRRLYVHSKHVALNVLLQGAGAVLMKKATVLCMRKIRERGLDAKLVLHVHDEYSFDCDSGHAEMVKEISEWAIAEAGRYFKFNIPMEGKGLVGKTWLDVH